VPRRQFSGTESFVLRIKLKYGLVIIFVLLVQCSYLDLKKIASTKPKYKDSFDTTNYAKTPNLTSQLNQGEDMSGIYSMIVIPGFQGIVLNLNKDSSFSEYNWSDVIRLIKFKKRGHWSIRNNHLVLKDRTQIKYNFIYYKYSWTIFIIPTTKSQLFNVQFLEHKAQIDSLAPFVSDIRGPVLDRNLNYLNQLCFYRRPNK
jgi:hypothetical protein